MYVCMELCVQLSTTGYDSKGTIVVDICLVLQVDPDNVIGV